MIAKKFLRDLPFIADVDWMLRSKNQTRRDHYDLSRLSKSLPDAVEVTKKYLSKNDNPKKSFIFFNASLLD
ncbi:MAG: hypothetical protein UZ14_CFX002001837 [Chloroflexi bacterium OLB14]|nr:MAG: hypothetical protein UZ14_CFX002001837 [Chloroflexi bacterium OLB14]